MLESKSSALTDLATPLHENEIIARLENKLQEALQKNLHKAMGLRPIDNTQVVRCGGY